MKDKKNKMEKNTEEIKEQLTEENQTEKTQEQKPVEENNEAQKISELEKELNDYKDKFVRKVAEFENYKRRTENEQVNLIKYGAESFIVKFLPVIDDFERSLKHIDETSDGKAIGEGIRLIFDKMMKILEDSGVKKIEAIGKPFDVHYHEAIMQRPAEGYAPHTVLEEIQSGYMLKDKVIRHSLVIVSDDSTVQQSNSPEENNNSESKE